jgi:hypothetical protein
MNKTLQDIQKTTGIKQGKYDNEKNRLYNMCQMSIQMLDELWNQIEKADMINEQFCLDWLDKINEISVRN